MTREEVGKLVLFINMTYPNMKYDKEALKDMVDTWEFMLGEYDYEGISVALKSFVASDTSGFPPAIGQVLGIYRKLTAKATGTEELGSAEAWAMVRKAISNGTYGSEKEFARLPEMVQKAVGSASQIRLWAMDDEFNEGVIHSQFVKSYNAEVERKKEFDALPQSVKDLLERGGSNGNDRLGNTQGVLRIG